jgi:hypothetical protein
MKVVARNIKKEDIVGYKGHMKWFEAKKEINEILMMVNEKQVNNNGVLSNVINYKESLGKLCIDSAGYAEKFFNKYQGYEPRVFIRQAVGSMYIEFAVDSWCFDGEGLLIKFE